MARPPCKDYVAKFWTKVSKRKNKKGCWIWTAGKDKDGYGIWYPGYITRAHVYSWVIHFGPTDGLWVLHKCDNPSCVNPQHLFLGNVQDNVRDALAKGRWPTGRRHWMAKKPAQIPRGEDHWTARHPERIKHGDDHGNAKLTKNDVEAIRSALAVGTFGVGVMLARKYNVHPSLISAIRVGKAWVD